MFGKRGEIQDIGRAFSSARNASRAALQELSKALRLSHLKESNEDAFCGGTKHRSDRGLLSRRIVPAKKFLSASLAMTLHLQRHH